MDMGIPDKGTVIPWFYWKNATDGTYSEPNKNNYVAIKWDNGTKGFAPVAYLTIIHDNGTEEPLGEFISDEEYDNTSDNFKVFFNNNSTDTGYIEFDNGYVDNFIIYKTGKIAFDNWYPENKYNMLVNAINQKLSD